MALRHFAKHTPFFALLTILSVSGMSGSALAATQAGSPTAARHIVDAVDDSQLVVLAGHTLPVAAPKFDRGAVSDSLPLQHMFLQLRRSPEQEELLARAIDEMQDPHSASYHHWLTAEELGTKYGPAREDIETVVHWLNLHGFQVNEVHKNGLSIDVSGTAGEVREAFHTEIHHYLVNGKQHIANASDPQIPAALSPVVVGFTALHDFMPKSQMRKPKANFSFPCTGCPDGFKRYSTLRRGPRGSGDYLQCYPPL